MKFQDRPIQYKISVMTLIVLVVPMFIFYVTITLLYNRAFEKRSNQEIKENIEVMSDRIEQVVKDGVLCSNYLTLNLNAVNQENLTHPLDMENRIRSQINQALLIFDGIDSIVYFDDYLTMYSTSYDLYDKRNEILDSSYFRVKAEIINTQTTLFARENNCMDRKAEKPVLTLGKRVVEYRTGELMGYLFINLDIENLESSMTNDLTQYFLFDTANNSVVDTGLNAKVTEYISENLCDITDIELDKVNIYGRSYLLAAKKLETGYTLVGVTDLRSYNITAFQLFRAFLIAGLLTVLLLIWLEIKTSKMITRPLIQLKEGAEEIADGNLDVKFHFKTGDEIGRMGSIFNNMTQKIKELLQLVEEEARKKRAYELALVQQQVKPHFLYNTLDIIIMLIDMNRAKDAQRVTKKLADYYKNSLSSSAEIIPLSKEIRIIEDYLDLQLMRYQDKFTYDIDVDTDLAEVLIPKLTLQPLVENAIYHGLKYKENWGNISINVRSAGDNVELVVNDNGVGMNADTIAKLSVFNEKPGEHFGVYSVNHRLKLYYGDKCDMKIESEEGVGTSFIITIPKNWREQE